VKTQQRTAFKINNFCKREERMFIVTHNEMFVLFLDTLLSLFRCK